jgi:hypothetical protein
MRLTTTPQFGSRSLATLTRDDDAEDLIVPCNVREKCDDGCLRSAHGLAHVMAQLRRGEFIPVSDVDAEGDCQLIGYLSTSTLTPDLDPTGMPSEKEDDDEESAGANGSGDDDEDDNEFDKDGFFDHEHEHEHQHDHEHEREHEHHHHGERPEEDAGGKEKLSPRQSSPRVLRLVGVRRDRSRGNDSPRLGLFAVMEPPRAGRKPCWEEAADDRRGTRGVIRQPLTNGVVTGDGTTRAEARKERGGCDVTDAME